MLCLPGLSESVKRGGMPFVCHQRMRGGISHRLHQRRSPLQQHLMSSMQKADRRHPLRNHNGSPVHPVLGCANDTADAARGLLCAATGSHGREARKRQQKLVRNASANLSGTSQWRLVFFKGLVRTARLVEFFFSFGGRGLRRSDTSVAVFFLKSTGISGVAESSSLKTLISA